MIVFAALEPLFVDLFEDRSATARWSGRRSRASTYADAMCKYGCDKPDQRNPLDLS